MVIKNTWDYVQVIQAQMTFQSEAFLSMPLVSKTELMHRLDHRMAL